MKKLIYIIGSAVIGSVSLLSVLFVMVGGGVVETGKNTLVLRSADATAVYSDEALRCDEWELEEGELKDGYSLQVTVSGEQTEVGSSVNHLSAAVLDETGADVTDQYTLDYHPGTLTVSARPLEVVAASREKTYDGLPLSGDSYTVLSGSTVEGHSIVATYSGSQTAVGSCANTVSVKILDGDGKEVTHNYQLQCQNGTLTVYKRFLTLQSSTETKIYDGTPLRNADVRVAEGSIADGQHLSVEGIGYLTNVGELNNTFKAQILDAKGESVTENYDITYLYGTLQVIASRLTLYTGDAAKIYDGTPLTCSDWGIVSGQLAKGEVLHPEFTGTLTDVGAALNSAVFSVRNSAGIDTTQNYVIDYVRGTLTVTPYGLVVSSASATKMYDGTALTNTQVTVSDTSPLIEGHVLRPTVTGTQTVAGESQNLFTFQIFDAEGREVTANYDATVIYGTLTVTKRPVTVVNHGGNKVYDGTALTVTDLEILSEIGLVDGHRMDAVVTGTQTNAGSSDNTFSLTILDGAGVDVTENYELTLIAEKLEVLKRTLILSSPGAQKVYDGTPLTAKRIDGWDESSFPEGQTLLWSVDGTITDVGIAMNTYTAEVVDADGFIVSQNYDITRNVGLLRVTPYGLTVTSPSDSKMYDGTPLERKEVEVLEETPIPGGHVMLTVVSGTQTSAGESKNDFTVTILNSSGADVTKNFELTPIYGTLTVTKRPVTILNHGGEKVYDGTALTVTDLEIISEIGLVDGHRLDPIVTGTQTNVGESENEFSVAVLDQANADVTGNYELTLETEALRVTPRLLILASADGNKTYDGTPLTKNEALTVCEGSELLDGHTVVANITGTITDVGSVPNDFTFEVIDQSGQLVTDNYQCEPVIGTLTVTKRPVSLASASDQRQYDGTPLKGETVTVEGGSFVDGHVWTAVFDHDGFTNVNNRYGTPSENNVFYVTVTDGAGNDVTANYDVTYLCGTLTVTPRPITVKSLDGTKLYDGTPLVITDVEVIGEIGLVGGHRLVPAVTGSQTDVGSSRNTFTVTVLDGADVDVTENYQITPEDGTLRVLPRTLILQSGDAMKVYDGTPLTNTEALTVCEGSELLDGHTIIPNITGTITNVGNVQNLFTVTVLDAMGEDVTHNYDYRQHNRYGTLTVTPRAVVFESESATKVYDGTPLSKETVIFDEDALLDGHTVTSTFSHDGVTDVNIREDAIPVANNRFSVVIADGEGNNVSGNYDIDYVYGTLTVTPRPVTYTSGDAQKEYDGTPLKKETASLTEGTLVDGHSETVLFVHEGVTAANVNGEVMPFGNNPFVVRFTEEATGRDVSFNYAVTYVYGTLTVTPRPIMVGSPAVSHTYDGTVVSAHEYSILSEKGLLTGYTITESKVEYYTSAIDVGQYPNELKVTEILDGNGQDVTANYDISYRPGMLSITQRPISISSEGAVKEYDGTPLTNPNWSVTPAMPAADGDVVSAEILGTRTEVGESVNEIGTVTVYSETRQIDVTGNYSVNRVENLLIVKGNTAGDSGDNTDGGNLDKSGNLGGETEGEEKTVAEIYSTSSRTHSVYLRLISFGNFHGQGWLPADDYGKTLDGTYGYTYLSGMTMEDYGKDSNTLYVKSRTSDYLLPAYMQAAPGDYVIQTGDVLYEGSGTEYSVPYYVYQGSGVELIGALQDHTAEEAAYRSYVYDQYGIDTLDTETLNYMKQVIASRGFSKDDPDILNDVATYIRGVAEYDLKYDQAMDSEPNVAIAFMEEYKKGVCRHYATAGTLLYRALDIPARYVQGYSASAKPGEWNEVKSTQAHAWVEVYVDGVGWITMDVTGGDNSGIGDGELGGGDGGGAATNKLTLTPYDHYLQYTGDGCTLEISEAMVRGFDAWANKGYRYEATVYGKQVGLGIGKSTIEKIVIYDANDQVVTDQFELTLRTGKLQVYLEELSFSSDGISSVYSGIAVKTAENACRMTAGSLQAGHEIRVLRCTGSQTNVGTSNNTIEVKIVDTATGDDVTSWYKISKSLGKITVTARSIHVTVGSATAVYDPANPTPLECKDDYSVEGELCTGHKIIVRIEGSQTNVGYSDNTITYYKIVDETGADVTSNYAVTYTNGTLTVTRPVS